MVVVAAAAQLKLDNLERAQELKEKLSSLLCGSSCSPHLIREHSKLEEESSGTSPDSEEASLLEIEQIFLNSPEVFLQISRIPDETRAPSDSVRHLLPQLSEAARKQAVTVFLFPIT